MTPRVSQAIRINAVCPGYIATPIMDRFTSGTAEGRAKVIAEEPAGRMGTPEEIVAAAVWLCSDAAAFMVGDAIVTDGGQNSAITPRSALRSDTPEARWTTLSVARLSMADPS